MTARAIKKQEDNTEESKSLCPLEDDQKKERSNRNNILA